MSSVNYGQELDEIISRLGFDPDEMSQVMRADALAYLTAVCEAVREEAWVEGREDAGRT